MNSDVSTVKTFKTLAYEGSTGWSASEIKTDLDGDDATTYSDLAKDIAKFTYDFGYDDNNDFINILPSMFEKKENKYFSVLQNGAPDPLENEIIFGEQISGVKGMYMNAKLKTTENSKQELFAVSSEVAISSK